MTTLADVAAMLAAVHADPTNRDRWAILADAYDDVGDEAEERFWRFACGLGIVPYLFVNDSTGGMRGWGWIGTENGVGGFLDFTVWPKIPKREDNDTIQRCFERLRIGWKLAGRPE